MCIRSIADLIDRLNGSIYSRIKTNGKISTGNIFINGTREDLCREYQIRG